MFPGPLGPKAILGFDGSQAYVMAWATFQYWQGIRDRNAPSFLPALGLSSGDKWWLD